MKYNLCNRRYIGNKHALLDKILSFLNQEKVKFNSVVDLFAGTGVVAERFLSLGKDVIINDNLYSNYVFYQAWLSNLDYSDKKINKFLDLYNSSELSLIDNYFSDIFSDSYFSYENAKKIGSIREHLEKNKHNLSKREFYILLSSLLYTTDKIANTVGHFESFLATKPKNKMLCLYPLNLTKLKGKALIYQADANALAKKVSADLFYIDPPYNARQYINFYHLLENLAEWKKPKVYGKTLKMFREEKKSKYSTSKATECFQDLVNNISAKYILVSYNNTYKANSQASINKISEKQIEEILSSKGELKRCEIPYRFFNAGKTSFAQHKEFLYLCKVR